MFITTECDENENFKFKYMEHFFCVLNAALLKMINDRFVESLFFLVGIFSAFPQVKGDKNVKCVDGRSNSYSKFFYFLSDKRRHSEKFKSAKI